MGGSLFRQAVRDRILKVAQELNYRPSMAARNLTVSKTNLVAVLGVPGIWSDRVGPLEEAVGAMAKSLDESGYEICVQFMSLRHGPFQLPPLRVDGVVAVGPTSLDDLETLDASGIPYVSLDGVVADMARRLFLMMQAERGWPCEHLYELGHRRIAYLDHPSVDATHLSVFTRRDAFAQAVKRVAVRDSEGGSSAACRASCRGIHIMNHSCAGP